MLVVGPSGAGKDTLIDAARSRFAERPDIVFPRRTITRVDDTAEPHIAVSNAQFEQMERDGAFFLSWRAHGLAYGIPKTVLDDLRAEKTAVVNISRRVIDEAREAWQHCHVLHIAVKPEVLQARLLARGRETPYEIIRRLSRDALVQEAPWVSRIDNSGALESAVKEFNAVIERYASSGKRSMSRKGAA